MAIQEAFGPNTELALNEPLPLAQHPAALYLRQLAPKSRRVMEGHLNAIAALLTNSECDYLDLDWSKLRYHHTATVRAYLQENFAPATANLKLTALKQVLKTAKRLHQLAPEDYEDAVALPPIRGDTPLRGRYINQSEIARLLQACVEDQTITGIRDAAMIAVLCGGLRREEVVKLDLKDFDPQTGGLLVRQGKGKKNRQTYLPDEAVPLVLKWIELRGFSPGPLFGDTRNGQIKIKRLHEQTVVNQLALRATQSGVEKISPHDFRRTFISSLLDTGADIVTVQKLAGHSDPATTAKYDRRGESVKQQAVKKFNFPSL